MTRNVELVAEHNVVDSGDLSGTWSFRVVTVADADEDDRDSTDYQDNDAYSAISLPSLPVTVTGDDEPTEVFIESADTTDNIATEGDTSDTAKFKVRLSRALEAGEWVEVPLASRGAELSTHFTLALDGTPSGVAYADSSDGTLGLVRFTGPSVNEATVVVTAASDDGNSVTENMLVHTYRTSEPSQRLRIDTNLDEVCSGEGCGPGRYGERVYRVTLQEASDGLRIIDHGDGRLVEAPDDDTSTYEYEVRLNTAPANNVTLTTTTSDTARTQIASDKGTLTFTPSNWDTEQTMRVFARGNNTDEADQPFTVTHAFSGDVTYAALPAATHDLVFVDNDATTVTMAGTGVRTSSSGTEISEVMVEGDASRVDRSLTVSLSRALEAGEYVRVPLYLEAVGHSLNPDTTPCDLTNTVDWPDNKDKLPADLIGACNVVDSVRGPRYSANVAWPIHYNDFDMAASGMGVSVEAVNRRTPPHAGFRWLEFRGAGAQSATIELNARDGFDDGESFDEQFSVRFPNNLVELPIHAWAGRRHLNPDTNLSGGIQRAQSNVQAWYGITDDEEGGGSVPQVPAGWTLLPSGLNPGDSFRLLYATSQTTTAQSGNLAVYDAFVRAEITGNDLVNGGVAALADHAGHFKAIAETVGTTARDHAQFSPDDGEHPDVPIYWVDGAKVADDNADFTDGTWGDEANPKHADGSAATVNAGGYWTGSGRGGVGIMRCDEVSLGRRSTPLPRLGEDDATVGLLNDSGRDGFPLGPRIGISSQCGRQHGYSHDPSEMRPMYALSGEFTVAPEGAGIESATAAEGSAVMFAVTIPDAAPAGGITVPYSLSDGRGIAGELAYTVATGASGGTAADYDNDAGSVVIAQGQTTNTFTVSTTDDSTYEGDHFFTVTLGTPTGANPPGLHPAKGTATGTITDAADLPTVAFSSAAVSAGEGDETVDVTVARTGATLVPLSVFWTTADGTASHPGDYTAQSGTLEFAAGDTSKTLTVGIVDDDTAESTETFKIQLDDSQAIAAQVGSTAETTITLTDDDGGIDGVTLSASAIALTELDAANAEKTYTVVLDTDPGANVTVTVTSGDPTAVAVDTDSDTAGDQSTLTFTPGNAGNWSSAQTVTLRAVNDGDAAAETVTVAHTAEVSTDGGNPYHGIDIANVTATTVDAGHRIVVVPTSVSVDEGDTADYGIRLASDPGGAVVVRTTAVGGAGGSVTVSAESVSFSAGNWSVAQTVTVSGVSGGSAQVTHSVSSSSGGARSRYPVNMGGPRVDVTVVSSAALVFVDAEADELAVSEESGHTDTYEVKLSKAPSADVTVAITAAAGAAVNPASLTFTTSNWQDPQEVTVSGVDDNTINTGGARLVTISHATSSPDSDFNALSGNVTVRVADTDTTPTLGITPAQVQSSAFASGGTVTLTLTPEHVTFLFAGGNHGSGDGDGGSKGGADGNALLNGTSLTAAGLALLTFTGAPTGLTVDSAELGALMSDVHGQPKHRSVEVVLSYSGSAITADDTVTLNVDKQLLRRSLSAKQARRYGASLSADFTIKAPGPVTVSMAASDGDANGNAVEGASNTTGYRTVTITLGRALAGSEEVTVPLSVVGATVTDDFTFGLEPAAQTGVSLTTTGGTHTAQNPAVVFGAGASSATLRLKPVDNSVRSEPYVVVDFGTGARAPSATGATLGTVSGDPIGVVFVDDETGDFEVAADWPLLPAGLSGGDEFRLMFLTSQTRGAGSQVIDVYNEWAQGVVAAGGHSDLKPYGSLVRVVGSTSGADARVNTGMHTGSAWADGSTSASDSGVAVYWLAAPPSNKVADNYFDFYDGDWDGGADQSGADTVESGTARTAATAFWTGSDNDGTKAGNNFRLGRGMPRTAVVASGNPLSDSTAIRNSSLPMLVMSPVFKVEASTTGAPVSVTMSASHGDSDGNAVEGGAGTTGYRTVTIALGRALTASEEVTVPLSVVGATVADDFTLGLHPLSQTGVTLTTTGGTHTAQDPAVVFLSGAQTATLRLTPVDNNVRTQPYVIIDYGTGEREPSGSGGVTLGTPTGGPVGVVLVDDESGDIVLPPGAAFRPAVSADQEYRLLFMTSAGGPASSSDIADYDHFVRAAAVSNGGADLLPYAGFFRAFVSTAGTHGREHVGIWGSGAYADSTTRAADSGTGLYWLGTGGQSAALNHWRFCNEAWFGRWSATATRLRHEDGSVGDGAKVWTGMNNNCATSSSPLGTATPTYGPGAQAGSGSASQALSLGTEAAANENRFYAVSEVVKTVASADMPLVAFNQRAPGTNEGDAVRLTLTASPAPTADLTVTYDVAPSSPASATAGEDFTAGEASVTIPAGQTSVSFDVATLEDAVFEPAEAFRVILGASPDYLPGSIRSATVTINDDDRLKVGFAQDEYWVLEDSGSVDVDLTLSHHTAQAVSLVLSVGGTATNGSDYTAPATSVTIPSGNTSGTHTISIPIAADSTVEPDETIALAISSVSTSAAGKASRDRTTVFIADQDRTTPGLVVPSTVEVDEGRTAVYRLRLATAPTGTVTVTVTGHTAPELTLDADDEMANAQNSVQFDASNWYIGRKVTLGGVHDADLTDETVTLSHSASGAEYGSVTGSVAATVDDEDVTLSITAGAAVTEGAAAEFTVTASSAPERNLAVLVAIADAASADFVAAGQQGDKSRRLNAGQATATFTVPTVADTTAEPSGPITITLRTSDHYRIDSSASSAQVQVNDDDGPVTVTMTASRTSAVEGANDSTGYSDITITLGRALTGSEIVRVPLSVAGATVGSSNDFTFGLEPSSQTGVSLRRSGQPGISAQNPVIVFSSGGRTATLRLTPVDNGVRSQPYAVVDFGTQDGGTRSSGSPTVTLGTPSGGPIGVVFVDDESGDIEVAADWALAPSGLSAGDEFRLLYITSQTRNAESTDIGDYNAFVRRVTAEGGHAELKPYAGLATVVGSTAATDARENTAMWDPTANSNAGGHSDGSTSDTDSGVEIYWIAAPPTHKIADNYFDFYDGSWDTGADNRNEAANEAGTVILNDVIWTGTNNMGTSFSGFALGEATPGVGGVNSNNTTPLDDGTGSLKTNSNIFIAISPVFKVAAAATGPEVSVRLMVGEGENRNADGEVEKPESDATVSFPLTLDTQPATALSVCVRVAESGDTDRVAMADEGIKTVSFMSGVQSGSIDVAWTDTGDDDLDSVITVTAVPSSTVGCSSSDSYTVSGAHGSEKVRITDDEATVVTLTSSDTQMQEQDASDAATLTVSLGRALVAGESLVARITLATSTMARLPDHATPDFAVTASGTGVALTSATTVTPLLTFTGSDSNTVQTATVTLTPIATADDGDATDETVTAALSLITGTGSGTVVTGGGVEVGSSSTATLSIDDDETAACSAQSSILSVPDIRVTEMGGVATYCVRLLTAPSGGSTTVTVGEAAGRAVFRPSTFTVIESVSSGAATISPATLTFTASNYTEPQPVTVTAVDEANTNRNRRFNLTHTASGGGYSSQALGAVPVLVTDAPELEVFEHRRPYDEAAYNAHKRANGGWGIFRPNTLTSTPGLGPAPDITPSDVLEYFVRLSSQPDGEVTVTINVTDIAGYDADTFTGISFTGAPQQSLTFTFHDGDPTAAGCYDGSGGGDRYTQTRISWKCYRAIWVHNTRNAFNVEGTRCADVVHTATGGGFRTATVDTIRAFSLGRVYANNPKEFYPGVSIVVTGWWRVRQPTYTYDNKTGKFHVDYTGTSEWQTRTLNNIAVYRDQDTGKYYDLVNYERGTRIWRMREVPSSAIGTGTVWDQSGPIVKADTLNLETVYSSTGRFHEPADCPLLRRHYAIHHTPQNTPQNSPLGDC